jgi:hypothetical protein
LVFFYQLRIFPSLDLDYGIDVKGLFRESGILKETLLEEINFWELLFSYI